MAYLSEFHHQSVSELLERLGAGVQQVTFVEIGVLEGALATSMLRSYPLLRYYGVDPYRYQESGYEGDGTNNPGVLSHARYNAIAALNDYASRATLMEVPSHAGRHLLQHVLADLVFIDANHHEQNVVHDILMWQDAVRPGGILAGHDWTTWPTVASAVNLCHSRWLSDWQLEVLGECWAMTRPEVPNAT